MMVNKEISKAILLLTGGIGISLSGINWHIGITAWVSPIFLLMYTRNSKWYHLLFFFLVVSVSGAVSQTGNNLLNLVSVHLFNGLSYGILYSLPYFMDKLFYKKANKFYYSLLFPSAFVFFEFLISPMFGTWGSIAHTQFEIKPLMQLSSVFGIYGVSFMVFWFAAIINWMIERKITNNSSVKGVLIFSGILFIVLLYGEIRIGFTNKDAKTTKVAAVLSELDVHKIAETEIFRKLSTDFAGQIPEQLFSDSLSVKTLIKRTNKALKQGAKIIVWNEIALILNQNQKKSLISEIQFICSSNKAYVLLAFLEESADNNEKPFNNVSILISPKGEIEWEYLKSFLHPVAEVPIINAGDFNMPVVQTEYGKIGSVICADLDLTNYIKQAGKQSLDILLVPAFDWEGITPLHSQMAYIQAIQHGFSLVRSNGKGQTAIYDYKGNTIALVSTFESDTKIVYADIPVKSTNTLYSVIGDVLVYLAILFLLFLIVKKTVKRKDNSFE